MRQDEKTSLDVIGSALAKAHNLGQAGHYPGNRFNRQAAAFAMVHELDAAGFTIVPNPGPIDLVPPTGLNVLMSPRGERLIAAINHGLISRDTVIESWGGDPAEVDRRNAEAKLRAEALGLVYGALVHADGTVTPLGKEAMDAGVVAIGETPLEPGRLYELPHGTELRWPNPKGGPIKPPELYALTPKAEALVKAFVESVPLTQEAFNAGSDALEKEIERSFDEPLDAVPDEIADHRAEAVRRVIDANRLLAQAVEVLGGEAVDLLMHNLALPDLSEAA